MHPDDDLPAAGAAPAAAAAAAPVAAPGPTPAQRLAIALGTAAPETSPRAGSGELPLDPAQA